MAEGQIKQKLTPETVKKLEEVFAIDGTVEEACYYADISKQTYYNWIDEFPKMKEQFDRLRNRPILKARQEVIKGLNNYQNAMDYLKRKKRKEFGDNVDLTTLNKELPTPILNAILPNNSNQEDNKPDQED